MLFEDMREVVGTDEKEFSQLLDGQILLIMGVDVGFDLCAQFILLDVVFGAVFAIICSVSLSTDSMSCWQMCRYKGACWSACRRMICKRAERSSNCAGRWKIGVLLCAMMWLGGRSGGCKPLMSRQMV